MSLEFQNGGICKNEDNNQDESCDEKIHFDERCEMQIPRYYDFSHDPTLEKFDTETDELYRWFFLEHSFTKNNFSHIRRFHFNNEEKTNLNQSSSNRCKTPIFMKMERMKEAYNRHIEKIRSKANSTNCNTTIVSGK